MAAIFQHQPVLLEETIDLLLKKADGLYVDCTLGGAGHSEAILQRSPHSRILGIDQDKDAVGAAEARLAPYGERAKIVWDNFKNLENVLAASGVDKADGFLFDLGLSSPQLDRGERGFSYQTDAPLDMRMNRHNGVLTAKEIINQLPEDELAQIIFRYGEERWAKRIANFIVMAREENPVETTLELVDIIKAAVPKKAREGGPHPAKRTFQALRIAVNNELNIIAPALNVAVEHLSVGGRIAVISFHSLEDRIVKETFVQMSKECICPPGQAICTCDKVRTLQIITRKPVSASPGELEDNPRARSAKLRVGARV